MSFLSEDVSEGTAVPGATNVRYFVFGQLHLTLLVNLAADESAKTVASATSARFEDLPLLLDFAVGVFGGTVKTNIDKAAAVNKVETVDSNIHWFVDGTILKIVIDLSSALDSGNESSTGKKTLIASIRGSKSIGTSAFFVRIKLYREGGRKWPALLSPRILSESADESSPQSCVARALEFSPSVSLARPVHSPYVHPDLYELNEYITLDLTMFPIARLYINMDGKDGRVVKFTGDIISGIGISLTVEFRGDGISLLAGNRSTRGVKQHNVVAREERGIAGVPVIRIEFDTTKDLGESPGGRRIISNAARVIVNNHFKLDFTAIGPPIVLPSIEDMYRVVCRFFDLRLNPLVTLNMSDVRMFVRREYPQLGMTREMKNLVWEAVRLYVINDYIHHRSSDVSLPHTPLRVL